jgi:hypothetical protein
VKRVISMIHSIYIQVKNILHQKITIAVFGILMLLVFLNFLSNEFFALSEKALNAMVSLKEQMITLFPSNV